MNSLFNDTQLIENIQIMRNKFVCSKQHKDGRINSGIDDEQVKKYWRSFGDNYIAGNDREFYDLAYTDNDGYTYYINFKSSDFEKKSNDNLNAKEAILLAFTDLSLHEIRKKNRSWKPLINALKHNKKDINRDYYYIVFDKSSEKYIFTSVRSLDCLSANGNNLPYQCKWNKHVPQINRTFEQSYEYVTSCFYKSLRLRAEAYLYYEHLQQN